VVEGRGRGPTDTVAAENYELEISSDNYDIFISLYIINTLWVGHTVTLAALGYEGKFGREFKNIQISSCFSANCKIKDILINICCTKFVIVVRKTPQK
jgi:hypothetical protein